MYQYIKSSCFFSYLYFEDTPYKVIKKLSKNLSIYINAKITYQNENKIKN